MRPATVARVLLGGACIAVPTQLLAVIGGLDRDDGHTRAIVRVLGARLVAQSVADLALGPRTRGFDAAVDLIHAASMVPVAAHWPAHRRTAVASAAIATGTAVLDAVGGRAHRPRLG
ncbi:MAG TPA: hypothetical protein VGK78_09155 [Nocardioides sp.]|uniref:hypothetical protein n=1 Tax=Nocardioides sp. TaxID=35761 RepID=UPI002F3F94AD